MLYMFWVQDLGHISYCTMCSLEFIHTSFTFLKDPGYHHHSAFVYDSITTFAWLTQVTQVLAQMKPPQKASDLSY